MVSSINHTILNPVGVDKSIQSIQTEIFEGLTWSNCEVYGRVFKIESEKGFVPKASISGKDYKDIFTNDKKTANICFIVEDDQDTNEGILFKAKVKIVVMVNLDKINQDTTKRIDSDIQIEVINLISKNRDFTFKGKLETGIDNVFKGFNSDSIQKIDLHPFHVFSLNGEITYTISNMNCFK